MTRFFRDAVEAHWPLVGQQIRLALADAIAKQDPLVAVITDGGKPLDCREVALQLHIIGIKARAQARDALNQAIARLADRMGTIQ